MSKNEIANITPELLKELTGKDGPSSEYDLDLRSRNITKITCLEMLPKMRSLNLAYNKIERIENIARLAQLQKLQLFSNNLSKCDGLDRNVNLKILFLHENKITEIDEGMKELVNLETLRLGRNKINRIQNLKACVKLSTLDMCHNRLTSTQGLPPLVMLKQLNLSNNQITNLKSISRCNCLLELDISFNKLETLLPLKSCKKLKQLNASGNGLDTWKILPTLPQLRELYLNDNNLSSIPRDVHKRLPLLDVMELMNNRFTGIRALLPLAQMKNLCELSIANNKICQQIEYHRNMQIRFAIKVAKKLPSLKVLDGDILATAKADKSEIGSRSSSRSVTSRQPAIKSPRPGTASRSRPTLKSAHGRRTAKSAMLPLEKVDSKKERFRSMLERLRENVQGLDRLCSREQLAQQIELLASTKSRLAAQTTKAIAGDYVSSPTSSGRAVPATGSHDISAATAQTSDRRKPMPSRGMLRNALQFSKKKPRSQFHYRNKADRPIHSPRSTSSAGSVDDNTLLRPKSVPVTLTLSPQKPVLAGVSIDDALDRPSSAPSEVNAHDSNGLVRYVNHKTADKRAPLQNRRGRGLRKFKIPKSAKTVLSNEIL